jgi:hypothetical protein
VRSSIRVLAVAALIVSPVVGLQFPLTRSAATTCSLPTGALRPVDLPSGTNAVLCGAVGRIVHSGDVGVTVPSPGETVTASRTLSGGQSTPSFTVSVSSEGTITYPVAEVHTAAPSSSGALAASAIAACDDDTWGELDLKLYSWTWYVGDGGMPGALSRADAKTAFAESINNVEYQNTNCDMHSFHTANTTYGGYTTYESDMNASGDCTPRDGVSTWDAGDLPSDTVAQTCHWSSSNPFGKNSLTEADVRYNTHDNDFTNTGGSSSCSQDYDIRAVGTHETGHVFGLDDLPGSSHYNLTMYFASILCDTRARTLGLGDMHGLWRVYP